MFDIQRDCQRDTRDYHSLGGTIFFHQLHKFYDVYVDDIGRNAQIEKKRGMEGKPESCWQGAADASSSLIKTDRPLFFLGQAITRFIS